MKWAYPFNAVKQDEAVTAQTYFTALSQAEDGFFPMGGNGLWHGGIHFGNGTAGTLDQQSGVRAIASGEVIAYRLNEKYPVATYPDKNNAMYSSGFVLIRHRLTMPRAPVAATAPTSTPAAASASPASAAQGAPAQGTGRSAAAQQPASAATSTPAQPAQPADETLTFFSLYMHLMDWAGYQAEDAKQDATPSNDGAKAADQGVQHMGYWQGSKKYRLVPGSNVNNKQEQPPKAIPAAAPSAANTANSDPLGAFIANGFKATAPTPAPTAAAASTPIDPETVYTGNGLAIRRNPLSKSAHAPNSDILGILPLGAEFTIARDADTPGWGYIGDVLKGKIYPPKAGDALDPSAKTGCVYYKGMKPLTVPAPLDQVVVLDKPFSVNAGDVVGYLGEFQRYREGQTIPPTAKRSQLHLEVFAGDEFAAFFQKSKQRAAQLSDAQKSVLVISKGAKLVSESQADTVLNKAVFLKPVANKSSGGWWALVQPMTVTVPAPSATAHRQTRAQPHSIETPDGTPVWVKRPLSGTTLAADSQTAAWSKYPLNVSNPTASTVGFETAIPRGLLDKRYFGAVDDAGKHWWSTEFANEKGQIDAGWVCESAHPGTEWVSPFAWPGFEIVDHTGISLVDQFKRFLLLKNEALEGEDLTEFAPAAASVNGSDLIVKLESAIDKQGDGNGKVTAGELRRAMTKPWLAWPISRLVVRFESEWGGDMSKWRSLENLLGTGRYVWETELGRIERLQFWKDIAQKKVEGFPRAAEVYHFHLIGLVDNFGANNFSSLDALIRSIGDVIAGGEGGYEAYNSGTRDVPGGVVGHSYIRNGPAGPVTQKTINEILATESMSGTNPMRMFATGKYQTTFPTLQAAKTSLGLSGDEKYDVDMQERVFKDFLFAKAGRGGLSDFVRNGAGSVDDAIYAASKEWASIAVPNSYPTNKRGVLSNGSMTYFQKEGAANMANNQSTSALRHLLESLH
ncbi:lytic transglycosylase domain-containing protein [Robbsia sp. KACC 23696]|uniref:lytic transglycosylase domain-containing protein n=1 Tax=Robbsia sp. KACC 23696 TaxID=3149231 RepID=UPI00325BF02B